MRENSKAVRYIDFGKVWKKYIEIYTEVFECSLQCLSKRKCLVGNENEDQISVCLWKDLKKICIQWSLERNQEIPTPHFQTPVQDIEKASKKGMKTLNKPDFTCFRFNAFTGENIGLHIECKKLGTASASWNFNKNYITEGIMRFDSKEHQYGMNALSGMMVGYIVSRMPKDILKEVNEFQNQFLNGYPELKFDFGSTTVFKTQQKITRKNVEPKKFELFHLWGDLRQEEN